MGKSIPSPSNFQRFKHPIQTELKPKARSLPSSKPTNPSGLHKSGSIQPKRVALRKNMEMGNSKSVEDKPRLPLSEVVADCVKRWFEDTLKEAEAGDLTMQVLVGQMYSSGYGVPKNAQKGKMWIEKASKRRSSALKVGDKHPGYNVSDSDSDDGNSKGR